MLGHIRGKPTVKLATTAWWVESTVSAVLTVTSSFMGKF
jgi:hypothetical protein